MISVGFIWGNWCNIVSSPFKRQYLVSISNLLYLLFSGCFSCSCYIFDGNFLSPLVNFHMEIKSLFGCGYLTSLFIFMYW